MDPITAFLAGVFFVAIVLAAIWSNLDVAIACCAVAEGRPDPQVTVPPRIAVAAV